MGTNRDKDLLLDHVQCTAEECGAVPSGEDRAIVAVVAAGVVV